MLVILITGITGKDQMRFYSGGQQRLQGSVCRQEQSTALWGSSVNISEAMQDQNLFGPHFSGSSWANWRAVLKGAFSPTSMSPADHTVYAQATGRKSTPAKLRELWLIVGRRGSRNCDGMRRAMLGLPIAATRGQVRKAVDKHVKSCPVCTATRAGLASPLLVLAAFSLVTVSAAESEAAQ